MMKKVLMALCVLALAAGSASASSLAVTGAAALEGNYGLAVTVNNDGTNAYVEDNTPAAETTYRATFLIDVNNTFSEATALANGNNFLTLAQTTGDNPLGGPPAYYTSMRLYLMNRTVAPFCRARLGVWSNINSRLLVNPVGIDCSGTVRLTIEWQAGAAGTGLARLTSESPVIGVRVGERNLNNHVTNVQFFRMGHAVGAPPATVSGTLYLDSFESYRTLAP
jgi:hypothetical protein